MITCTKEMRLESDSIGTKELPADVYYGVQSLRALENFPITGNRPHCRQDDRCGSAAAVAH